MNKKRHFSFYVVNELYYALYSLIFYDLCMSMFSIRDKKGFFFTFYIVNFKQIAKYNSLV